MIKIIRLISPSFSNNYTVIITGDTQINYTLPGENLPSSNTIVIAKKFDSDQIEEKKIVKSGECLIESVKFSSKKTNEDAV